MKSICVALALLAGCGGPRAGAEAELQSAVESESASEPESEPEAQAEPEPALGAASQAPPLPPLPALAPFVLGDGTVLTVDRWDERTFVVIELIDELERAHPIDEDWNFDERRVEPSTRVVPGTFRLTGPAGACEGSDGRAVVITTHSVPYELDDEMLASTYRFSAVEVEASCEALFAARSEYTGRFEWLEPRMEREFTPGRSDAEGEQILAPIGARGTFGRGYRFEDHPVCDGTGPATMVVRHAGRRTRFEWSGQLAARFGLLRLGASDYFMALGLFEWNAHPFPASDDPGPSLERLPRLTSLDVDHVEMEVWVCLPPGMY